MGFRIRNKVIRAWDLEQGINGQKYGIQDKEKWAWSMGFGMRNKGVGAWDSG